MVVSLPLDLLPMMIKQIPCIHNDHVFYEKKSTGTGTVPVRFNYEGCLVKDTYYSAAAAFMALRRLLLNRKDRAVKARVMTIITAMTPPSLKCS